MESGLEAATQITKKGSCVGLAPFHLAVHGNWRELVIRVLYTSPQPQPRAALVFSRRIFGEIQR